MNVIQTATQTNLRHAGLSGKLTAALRNPAIVLFLSTNLVNAGNLLFNVFFSRLLGPELYGDLALLLTIKLSILCILGAIQFETATRATQIVRSRVIRHASMKSDAFLRFLLPTGGMIVLCSVVAVGFTMPDALLHEDNSRSIAFVLFALCLPFTAPLCVARGLSQGILDLKHVVLSAQIEMGVRLFGSFAAWFLGLGLPGIAAAIALSIILGWVYARPDPKNIKSNNLNASPAKPSNQKSGQKHSILGGSLMIAALPWAALQLGQVLALDGDFLVAKIFMSAEDSGQLAVSILVQRILFFGCFGLASAALPMVAAAQTTTQLKRAMLPIVGLFLLTSLPFIALTGLLPEQIIMLAFGADYINSAPTLFWSSVSGSCFVVIYLISTFCMANATRKVGYLTLFLTLCLLSILASSVYAGMTPDILSLIKLKAYVLMGCSVLFSFVAWYEFRKFEPG